VTKRRKGARRATTARAAPATAPPARPIERRTRAAWFIAAVLVVFAAAGVGVWRFTVAPTPSGHQAPAPAAPIAAASYIGTAACAQCHAKEHTAWQGSQHDRAMQVANEKTVLGNFAGAKFTYSGVTSTFFHRDGKYFVNTDGPDGKLADFEIRYSFGVEPPQQYLIELPGGRLQALGLAWDARPKAAGGQRWFHLYPATTTASGSRAPTVRSRSVSRTRATSAMRSSLRSGPPMQSRGGPRSRSPVSRPSRRRCTPPTAERRARRARSSGSRRIGRSPRLRGRARCSASAAI
jgi:hypothetical protein